MLVSWEEACAQFRHVRAPLSEHLSRFYSFVPEKRRPNLKVAIVEYDYGEKIIEDGWPYWRGGAPVPDEFIIAQGLPLGFILENSCEVLDYAVSLGATMQVSQALLPAGEAIGLFEMTDALTELPHPKTPAWQIVAGAASIHALPNLSTQQNINKLEKALGEQIDHFRLREATSLLDQLMCLRAFEDIRRDWRVKIAYFSKGWFDELMLHYEEAPASTLIRILLRQAWKSVARVRTQDTNLLYERLRSGRGAARNHMAAAAASLIIAAENVIAGRRPCFTPRRDLCDAGPFQAISETIIGAVTPESWILAPAYLNEQNPVGYMKLEHAASALMDGGGSKGMKDKVLEMMSILRSAAQKEANARHARFEVAAYAGLVEKLMFQTPSTRLGAPDTKPSVYRITFDDRMMLARPIALTPQDFYAPLFTTLPKERCPFFRNAVRVECA
ncbi:MAG: hypothetical protein NW215_02835 [Hyphomicrobiales bacterium]|nr:hypothetical protein [Hyphomicrobiales bacterium]